VDKLFEVIHEVADLLVLNKPADLVCHPTKGDAYSSLISRVRLYLGPALRPHLVNRLDRETSGVTVVAKTAPVAGELGRLWETRGVEKEYLAIVHGLVADETGVIDAPLGRDETSRVAIKDCVRPDGAPARTDFQVIRRFHRPTGEGVSWFTLLSVTPPTGRKHQIRIHLAHIGHATVGDKLYGGDEELYLSLVEGRLTAEQKRRLMLPCHALHAQRICFGWRAREWIFSAEPEAWLRDFAAGK
jgi:23S rRNA pseudouridine1911/1915/1917 synthase